MYVYTYACIYVCIYVCVYMHREYFLTTLLGILRSTNILVRRLGRADTWQIREAHTGAVHGRHYPARKRGAHEDGCHAATRLAGVVHYRYALNDVNIYIHTYIYIYIYGTNRDALTYYIYYK